MKKREFMNELTEALKGNVSSQTLNETVEYYENYFRQQKDLGRTEDEICASLGSARLIAKTIIDTEGKGASGRYYDEGSSRYDEYVSSGSGSNKKGWHINVDEYGNTSFAYGKLDFGSTLGKIILAIIAILVLALVIGIIAGALVLGFKIMLYIIVPVVIILFIVNLLIYLFGGDR